MKPKSRTAGERARARASSSSSASRTPPSEVSEQAENEGETREPLSSSPPTSWIGQLSDVVPVALHCVRDQCGAVGERPSDDDDVMSSAANMMHSAQGAVSSGGNKMLKLIWGKANQPTAERIKIQKELFQFQKVRVKKRVWNNKENMAWRMMTCRPAGVHFRSLDFLPLRSAPLLPLFFISVSVMVSSFAESCAKIRVRPSRMQRNSSKEIIIR